MNERSELNEDCTSEDRREFLRKAGKFAAATPPAAVLLFSTSLRSEAYALSGGGVAPRPKLKKKKKDNKRYRGRGRKFGFKLF